MIKIFNNEITMKLLFSIAAVIFLFSPGFVFADPLPWEGDPYEYSEPVDPYDVRPPTETPEEAADRYIEEDFVSSAANPGGFIPCQGNKCSACDLVSLVDILIKWLIGIMLIIFAMVVCLAGFKLVTSGGNPEGKTKAKSMFLNAFVGIIIVLAAWILVDTIMRALVPDGKVGGATGMPWSQLKCSQHTPT